MELHTAVPSQTLNQATLVSHICSLANEAGCAMSATLAEDLSDGVFWFADDHDEVPSAQYAQRAYQNIRCEVHAAVLLSGCAETAPAIEQHARACLSKAFTYAMFRSTCGQASVVQVHKFVRDSLDIATTDLATLLRGTFGQH